MDAVVLFRERQLGQPHFSHLLAKWIQAVVLILFSRVIMMLVPSESLSDNSLYVISQTCSLAHQVYFCDFVSFGERKLSFEV